MKRSNTANVDPRSINFADVKKSLEDKINKINSYRSKRGMYREVQEIPAVSPTQEQPQNADQNKTSAPQSATPSRREALQKALGGLGNRFDAGGYQDIHKKLDFLEQERLNDLRARGDDSKLSHLAKNLEKVEGRLENLQTAPTPNNSATQVDVSLDIIQRKLDKLEQDRIDSLRSKIEQEKAREIEKSISKIEEKMDLKENLPQKKQSNELLELIQRKIEKLEEDRVNDLKSTMEQEKLALLNKKIEKLESKLDQSMATPSVSFDGHAEFAKQLEQAKAEEQKVQHSGLVEKLLGDVVERLERLEKNRDLTAKESTQNNLERTIEKLETKIEKILHPTEVYSPMDTKYSSAIDSIQRKLEKLEKDRFEEFKEKMEGNRISSLERSLERIEDSLSYKRNSYTVISERDGFGKKLDRLEQGDIFCSSQNLGNSQHLQKSLSKIESKLESIRENACEKTPLDFSNMFEKIEKKNSDESIPNTAMSATPNAIHNAVPNTIVITEHSANEDAQYILDKNNVVLENISIYLKDLTEEFKHLYAKDFPNSLDGSNQKLMGFLESLQNKYLDSIKKIENSLNEAYKNDSELKKYMLEQDLVAGEVSKLQGEIINKKSSAQTSLLVDEINKLKMHIDAQNSQANSVPNENNAPLIEDIKNLLSEVNYRNKVLSETVDDSQDRLSNVVSKVETLSSSISNIEGLVNKISINENLSEKYKDSLDENFTKLKADNYKIIEFLHNNSKQSNLLSEKANVLIKDLRDDIINISSLEKKSILEELSNVASSVLEFKKSIEKQELKEDKALASLPTLLVDLDSIASLQEDTSNYFKSLDSNIEKNLINIQKNSNSGNNNLISEVKLYLEDSKSKIQYFNELKNKIDQKSVAIAKLLSKPETTPAELVDSSSNFKLTLQGLSNAIAYLLEAQNKTATDLNTLIEKTDKILSSDSPKLIGEKIAEKIDDKTLDAQPALNATPVEIEGVVAPVSSVTPKVEIKAIDIKESTSTSVASEPKQSGAVHKKAPVGSSKNASSSNNKLMELEEELANVSFDAKTLSDKPEKIKIDTKGNKSSLTNVSENIKIAVASTGAINYGDTIRNVSEKVSILKDKQEHIENLIDGFQGEIKSNLSPYVTDKHFLENFSKFIDFSSSNIKSIKQSIQSFNTNLSMYLVEDKIMTDEALVDLLTSFEEIISFQENFFKIYTLNSDRLMGFAKKAEATIPEVDVKKAEKIHANIQQSISEVSLKNKKEVLKNITTSNNAKISKKVDLLANMDYLNKEITKKTKK